MFKKYCIIAMILLMVAGMNLGAAETYMIDVHHSSVSFTVSHMVVSKVRGNFNEFSGSLVWDENDLSKCAIEATINVDSIDTRNENRDGHLKSPDFFDVKNHPNMTFKSTRIEKKGDQYIAIGPLTMRGTTKEIKVPFKITGKLKGKRGTRLGAEGFTILNRKDFGVNWNRSLDEGGVAVGEQVNVELLLEMVEKKPEEKKEEKK